MEKDLYSEQGYLKCNFQIPETLLDEVNRELQPYWANNKVPAGILNAEAQQNILDKGTRRFQEAWSISKNIHDVATFPTIMEKLRELYGYKPLPFQTLNFDMGTEQEVHSDAVHFNSDPFGMMCGVWIALEDISVDQGPLIYYPGSHTMPELTSEILGFEICLDNYPGIVNYWKEKIVEHQYKEVPGILKKGEAILWSANLLHGGSAHTHKSRTRLSMVTHYYFEGCKPWRPLYSLGGKRKYFEPEWIPVS